MCAQGHGGPGMEATPSLSCDFRSLRRRGETLPAAAAAAGGGSAWRPTHSLSI